MWDSRDVIWYRFYSKIYGKIQWYHYSFIWSRVKPVQVVHPLGYFQRELSLSSDYKRNHNTCASLTSSYKTFSKGLAGPDPIHYFCSFSFALRPGELLLYFSLSVRYQL